MKQYEQEKKVLLYLKMKLLHWNTLQFFSLLETTEDIYLQEYVIFQKT